MREKTKLLNLRAASVDGVSRFGAAPRVSYLRDFVYGGIDGAVTTFAVVAGVVGAELAPRIVLVLGLANLLADGFSMAASNYSGTRTEEEEEARLRAIEGARVHSDPTAARGEVQTIYAGKGFAGADLERAVAVITADHGRWVETIVREGHGLAGAIRSPLVAALATFAAFVVCGSAPLLPYLFGTPFAFETAVLLTGIVFFAIGSIKSYWSPVAWWRSGLGTASIGMAAASIAYIIGHLLKSLS